MKNHLETFLPDLPAFREKIEAFDRGEVSVADYKKFSGGYGSYAQKGAKAHMIRLRLAGGRISKETMGQIASLAERYGVQMAKLTTCESIQFHNLPAKSVPDLMEEVWKAGMITRGGGGDFPRNVMASPLAGLERGEPFDVTPYAEATAEFLLGLIKGDPFPRKLKVCFSNGVANVPHATFRDLGFVAKENKKFDVYAAGGLGNNPSLGVKVAKDVEPSDILYHVKAMVKTFLRHGNYQNRAKARTRYLKEVLGEEGFIAAYRSMLESVQGEDLTLSVKETPVEKRGDGSSVSHPRVTEQKQEGLYAVNYHPITGQVNPAVFRILYETVRDMEGAEFRLSPDSSLYIVNLTGDEAKKVLAVTQDGAQNEFEASTCCVGVSTCQGGLGDSPALIRALVERTRKEGFQNGTLPKICVSGCPSSCAAHQVAAIGFRGAMKPTKEGPKPAFAIFVGGSDEQGKEVIATAGKVIETANIPDFFAELGKIVEKSGLCYREWVLSHRDELDALIEKYAAF